MSDSNSALFGLIVGGTILVLIVCLLTIAIGIAIYVWFAIEYYLTLKRFNYKNAWLAFIPFANYYSMGDICREQDGNVTIIGNFRIRADIFNFWFLVPIVAPLIPIVGTLLSIISTIVLQGRCYKEIYSRLLGVNPSNIEIQAYLSTVIPFMNCICLHKYRNNVPKVQYEMQQNIKQDI